MRFKIQTLNNISIKTYERDYMEALDMLIAL